MIIVMEGCDSLLICSVCLSTSPRTHTGGVYERRGSGGLSVGEGGCHARRGGGRTGAACPAVDVTQKKKRLDAALIDIGGMEMVQADAAAE